MRRIGARALFLLIAPWLLVAPAVPQETTDGLIPYRRLSWRDFPVDDAARPQSQQACTQGRVTFRFRTRWMQTSDGFTSRVAEITFRSWFDPSHSWRRSRLLGDKERILQHEQGHLDLSHQSYLRLAHLAIESFGTGTGQTVLEAETDLTAKVKAIFETEMAQGRRLQARYDEETEHGRHPAAQSRWERAIAEEIARLL